MCDLDPLVQPILQDDCLGGINAVSFREDHSLGGMGLEAKWPLPQLPCSFCMMQMGVVPSRKEEAMCTQDLLAVPVILESFFPSVWVCRQARTSCSHSDGPPDNIASYCLEAPQSENSVPFPLGKNAAL